MKKITKTTLEKWNACVEGLERFNELFPKGADLKPNVRYCLDSDGNFIEKKNEKYAWCEPI